MKQNYHTRITAKISPQEMFENIADVSKWWAKKFEGKSSHVGDIFTVRFESGDRFTIKVAEFIDSQKIVWDVINASQTWLKDPQEWVGTKIVFEISSDKEGTHLDMTHVGLTPDVECYGQCRMGWDYLMQKSLTKLLKEGQGLPV